MTFRDLAEPKVPPAPAKARLVDFGMNIEPRIRLKPLSYRENLDRIRREQRAQREKMRQREKKRIR